MEQINFRSQREFVAVCYPGLVKNEEKMIEKLGGITRLSQALDGEHKRLELRFHSNNPFNKPCFGEAITRPGLLLSVTIRRNKRTNQRKTVVRIVGHSKNMFVFESLCDFQFLPIYNDSHSLNLSDYYKDIMPKNAIDTKYFNNSNIKLLSMPHAFARTDMVYPNIYRTELLQEDGQHETLGVVQKSSYDNRDIVVFNMNDNFPSRPDSQIMKKMKVKYVSDEQLEIIKKLFDSCPIWTRIALLHESGVSNDKLKCIIPSIAYYFSNGPWRTFFVRYGYDPRKDFNSRFYQTFDFRLRFRSGVGEFVSNRRETIRKKNDCPNEISSLTQDINYPYLDDTKLPRSRQCILRYCDVHIPKIQDMLKKIPTPLTGAICNERTGWLPPGFDTQVRQIVSNSIREIIQNHYRKEQIPAELNTFEDVEQVDEDNYETDEAFDSTQEATAEDMQVDSECLA